MKVALDAIDREVDALWEAKKTSSRVRAITLVAVCANESERALAEKSVPGILGAQPGRAIIVSLEGATEAPAEAEISLVIDAKRDAAIGERIALSLRDSKYIGPLVERLIVGGSFVLLWWLGDLPNEGAFFETLAEVSDAIAFDSSQLDLHDIGTLSRFARTAQGRCTLTDLDWLRLRPWLESMARFFDDPIARGALDRANELEITCATPPRGDFTSAQAALYACWFASRVKLEAISAWSNVDGVHSLETRRKGKGAPLTLRFRQESSATAPEGALTQATLRCEGGPCFKLALQPEDPRVLGWSGECEGTVIPEAVMRLGPPDAERMLRRFLDRPERDALFHHSLDLAAKWFLTKSKP